MKLVREHINEKFTDESDPIKDMGIGLAEKIRKWLNDLHVNYRINKDLSITVKDNVNLYSTFEYSKLTHLPDYIKFDTVYGDFCVPGSIESCKGFPKIIKGNFNAANNNIKSLDYFPEVIEGFCSIDFSHFKFSRKDILKRCKLKMGFS